METARKRSNRRQLIQLILMERTSLGIHQNIAKTKMTEILNSFSQ